jgi:hypothetical protein
MVNYICPKCDKVFKQKSNYVVHTENKKNPCNKSDFLVPPKSAKSPPNSANFIEYLLKEPEQQNNDNKCICSYCEKSFTRIDSLKKHLNGRCKSKENHDELEKLKEEMKFIMEGFKNLQNNYQNMENENIKLKNEIEIIQKEGNKNNNTQIINNNDNRQINKGIIQNNFIVQFGEEDIDKIDLKEAMKIFLNSTGGNIISNMLKYVNLNAKYPENNNLCITDNVREKVKMHNGQKFVYKKFKNVKDEIVSKGIRNTKKIIKKYKEDETIIKTQDRKDKIKINEVSLKLIDGNSGEDIVREEINEKEPKLFVKNKDGETIEIERDLTFDERMRVKNLDSKSEGLRNKTYENIKEELYNARDLIKC